MNKLIKPFIIIIILIISNNIFGQEQNIYIDGYAVSSNIVSFTITKSNTDNSEIIQGNPYYNREWMFGELKPKNSSPYKGLFKYNIILQQMEMIYEKDTFIISKPLYIEYIKFANITFIYSLIINSHKKPATLSGSYFKAHNDLNYDYILLTKYTGNIKVNDFGNKYAGSVGDGKKRYDTNRSYYVKLFNGPAQKVHLSKNSIIKLFPNKKFVEKYINKNKLNMNNVSDVIKLFNHLNKRNLTLK